MSSGQHDALEAIETSSTDELQQLQLRRMQWSVRHAYDNVAHYKKTFDEAGVHPDDLHSLADLAKFPFTTKQNLRANYPFGMFAIPMDQVIRIHASSGTTGKPTVVGYSRADIDVWSRVVARSIRAAGGTHKDKIHVAYGYGLFTGGLGAHYGGEYLGCAVIPMSGGQTEKQAQLIQDFDPDIIMVTPSYMLSIADELERQGVDCGKLRLRVGLFGAEPWTDAMRGNLEARLGIDATDIYGLSEVIGPGVAQECAATKDGPTIWEDHFYPEIIDPNTGAPRADGGQGELVFTSLTKEALPVIRYRTGDLTRLLPGTARTMRRMDKITGRTDDMLIIRGVNVFPTQIEEQILKVESLAPHYQIEISRRGNLDELTINVELRSAAGPGARAAAAAALSKHTKEIVGVSAAVNVLDSGGVARSQGKAQRVVDRRQF